MLIVVSEALVDAAKGPHESWQKDRRSPYTMAEFERRLEQMLPGIREFCRWMKPGQKTSFARLMYNRVYKHNYSGTSDRGENHDKSTRATRSGEDWRRKVPADHNYRRLYDDVRQNRLSVVPRWWEQLAIDPRPKLAAYYSEWKAVTNNV